ncbi:MAG: hypothetical protein LC117_10530 [Bacteroidia bacterium]|nr:hypothetical protein [Bacteroidia bacterium]
MLLITWKRVNQYTTGSGDITRSSLCVHMQVMSPIGLKSEINKLLLVVELLVTALHLRLNLKQPGFKTAVKHSCLAALEKEE